jgi:hypothetical protein
LTVNENNVAFGSDGQSIIAFDINTGIQQWSFQPGPSQGAALLDPATQGGLAAVELADFNGEGVANPTALVSFDPTGAVTSTPFSASASTVSYFDPSTLLAMNTAGQGERVSALVASASDAAWFEGGNQKDQLAAPPASLSCVPATVVRAQSTTCEIKVSGAAPGAKITLSGWSFTDGTNTVTSTNATSSWPGKIVTSGTVSAKVSINGRPPVTVSATLTVTPRTDFAFTAVNPVQLQGNTLNCNGKIKILNSPPQDNGGTGDFLGFFCVVEAFSFGFDGITDNGPNNGYGYITKAFSQNQDGTPTTFQYIIVSDLLDSSSQFYRAQCGNFDPQSNPNGFISGLQLKTNSFDHEEGPVLSHWTNYVQAQNNPSNNIGLVLEGQIAVPGVDEAGFRVQINSVTSIAELTIAQITMEQPCGGDVRRDSSQSCTFFGNINFNNQLCN